MSGTSLTERDSAGCSQWFRHREREGESRGAMTRDVSHDSGRSNSDATADVGTDERRVSGVGPKGE